MLSLEAQACGTPPGAKAVSKAAPTAAAPPEAAMPEPPTKVDASAAHGALPAALPQSLAPLTIAYSDWPGWTAWEIAIQKGWFEEAGVAVSFHWLDYVASMEAFAAGKVDALCTTNGDALVTGATGAKSVSIIINDYSDGSDMVVARLGIRAVAQLKGRTIGLELGFIEHLLLLRALEAAHLRESDVTLKNMPTDDTPRALQSGLVDAVAAWAPHSFAALAQAPGSRAIFTSKDVPGLIYDVLAVSHRSLNERRADWVKVAKVWDRVASFANDPHHFSEAVSLMSARVRVAAPQYERAVLGTHIMGLAESRAHWLNAQGLASIYGSSRIVDDFNLKNGTYNSRTLGIATRVGV